MFIVGAVGFTGEGGKLWSKALVVDHQRRDHLSIWASHYAFDARQQSFRFCRSRGYPAGSRCKCVALALRSSFSAGRKLGCASSSAASGSLRVNSSNSPPRRWPMWCKPASTLEDAADVLRNVTESRPQLQAGPDGTAGTGQPEPTTGLVAPEADAGIQLERRLRRPRRLSPQSDRPEHSRRDRGK